MLAYGSAFDFGAEGAPVLTTTPSQYDVLGFVVRNSKLAFTGIKKGLAV
jgi:hypothetical protein